MKQETLIMRRAGYLRDKIMLLDGLHLKEMNKPIKARDYHLLVFLKKERDIYAYALRQFEWILTTDDVELCETEI